MYFCPKCKKSTVGTVKQITFEVDNSPYGTANEYKDCVVCKCGEIICCAPSITPEQAYREWLECMDEQGVDEA